MIALSTDNSSATISGSPITHCTQPPAEPMILVMNVEKMVSGSALSATPRTRTSTTAVITKMKKP